MAVVPTPEPALLRVPAVAERLNVSVGTVYRLIAEGRLRAVRLSERNIRVDAAEVADFIASTASAAS